MSQNYRTGTFINHGSAASLDDLAAVSGGFSVWAWVYRGANGNNQYVMSKDQTGPNGWDFLIVNSPSEGCLRFLVFRATTITDFVSSTVAVPLDAPTFVAVTFNSAVSPTGHLYYGNQTTAVAEVSYNTSTDGAGAITTDVSASLYVGNLQRATTGFINGSIQMGGIVSGSVLTSSNFETIRGLTLNAVNTDTDLSDVQAAFGHVLLFNYQDGTLTDRSGTGNNGTSTNTQSGPDFPIPSSTGGGGSVFGALGGVLT